MIIKKVPNQIMVRLKLRTNLTAYLMRKKKVQVLSKKISKILMDNHKAILARKKF